MSAEENRSIRGQFLADELKYTSFVSDFNEFHIRNDLNRFVEMNFASAPAVSLCVPMFGRTKEEQNTYLSDQITDFDELMFPSESINAINAGSSAYLELLNNGRPDECENGCLILR